MEQKNKNKWLFSMLSLLLITFYNRWLFWKTNIKKKSETHTFRYYHWKWGKIHYTVQGTGKPILLIHGIGAGNSSFEWHRNIKELKKHYCVYTIDLLGFGYSDKPKMTYTAFLYTQLIRDFIQDIIQEPTDVMASSLSCSFVTMACQQYPYLFKKLIFFVPAGVHQLAKYPTKIKRILRRGIEAPFFGTIIYNCISSHLNCKSFLCKHAYYFPRNVTKKVIQKYYDAAHFGGPSGRYAIASFIGDFMNVDISNAFQELENPILVIWGEEAKILPLENLQHFQELRPHLQSAIIPRTRLLPHAEASSVVNEICLSFLKQEK
ncbi:MAG: alpha/beta fold hydrolase [Epulopiscium sp.]|nr:alpha/beta fold hydrolase [Candidatus Epulonipiscium sp.]